MATVKVYRYDADTGKAISTFVRVGKFGTDKADKEDTATISEFHLPYSLIRIAFLKKRQMLQLTNYQLLEKY